MRILPHVNASWFILESTSGEVLDYVRMSIHPSHHRRYVPETSSWLIHISHLPAVVSVAEKRCGFIDYSALSEELQLELAHNKLCVVKRDNNPYAVMHLLPTAPLAIVDAAFRALAKVHHPDCGGDEETFKTIVEAYDRIKTSAQGYTE